MRKLRIVNLSNNQIVAVPKNILKLKKLEHIDLSYNLLSTFNGISALIELFRIRKTELIFNL